MGRLAKKNTYRRRQFLAWRAGIIPGYRPTFADWHWLMRDGVDEPIGKGDLVQFLKTVVKHR